MLLINKTDKQETDTTIETDTTYVTDKQETDTTIETDTTYDTDKQETDTTDETDQYDTDSTDESDKEEEEPSDYVGKIKAIYEVSTSNSTINILGERSNIDSSKIKIYINDTEIPFTKKYYFKSPETCTIIFELMNELNLNHIFHNIPEIISVEITSSNDKHRFGITSMKNAFYKSPNLQNVSVSNVKFLDDMSYAFADIYINELYIDNIDTSSVTNMSYLFFNNFNRQIYKNYSWDLPLRQKSKIWIICLNNYQI